MPTRRPAVDELPRRQHWPCGEPRRTATVTGNGWLRSQSSSEVTQIGWTSEPYSLPAFLRFPPASTNVSRETLSSGGAPTQTTDNPLDTDQNRWVRPPSGSLLGVSARAGAASPAARMLLARSTSGLTRCPQARHRSAARLLRSPSPVRAYAAQGRDLWAGLRAATVTHSWRPCRKTTA